MAGHPRNPGNGLRFFGNHYGCLAHGGMGLHQQTLHARCQPDHKEAPQFIGSSALMVDFYKQIARVADAWASVLIEGESGTGKELAARALHQLSSRQEKPFVVVNCGAIPDNLLESELFGYEK